MFGLNKNVAKSNRLPTAKTLLTNNLVASVWEPERDGRGYLSWDIARKNPYDSNSTYSTLRVENLLEIVPFALSLSEFFRDHAATDPSLRERLHQQVVALDSLVHAVKSGQVGQPHAAAENGFSVSKSFNQNRR